MNQKLSWLSAAVRAVATPGMRVAAALAFAGALACTAVGCSAGTTSEDPNQAVGTIEMTIANYEDGSSRTRYFLRNGGESTELSFQTPPSLVTGDEVGVVGEEKDGVIVVEDYTFLGDDDDVAQKKQALTGNSVRMRSRLAVIMVHWNSPNSLTPSEMDRRVFSGPESTRNFYKENSYNLLDVDGDVFGWFQIPDPGSCDTGAIANAARAAAANAGADINGYNQFLYYFPRTSACGWSGLAQVGRPTRPAANTWYNGSSGCVVLAQEILHNFGALHSHSYTCSSNGQRVPLATSSSCSFQEYGHPYDPMGGGCYHVNTYQKASQGWFGGCNSVTTTADGTFDIVPTEAPSNAIQTLRIPMDSQLCPSDISSCYYYIGYRQPIGAFSDPAEVHEGVLVHVGPGVDFDGLARPQGPYLLDMHPSSSSFRDAALKTGEVYEDPTGIRIELVSRNFERAQVRVSFPGGGSGGPRCIDGSIPPGSDPVPPGNCDAGEFEFGDHCYFLTSSSSDYNSARAACQNHASGWGLSEIGSSSENNFVASLTGSGEFWLGGNDLATEGTFRWETGTAFWSGGLAGGPAGGQYANFVSGEPNDGNGNSDCVRMIGGGGWRDIQCSSSYRAVCESDMGSGPSCTDGSQNGDETDADCGGSCSDCADGKTCKVNSDCQSNNCNSGVCRAAPSCNDRVKNGNETDVDCGGSCADCADGKICTVDSDCQSNNCDGGVCRTSASCDDGIRNADETDVDCGGSCAGCANGDSCNVGGDCQSGNCEGGVCTSDDPPPSGDVTVVLKVTDEWSTGYCTDIQITNNSGSATSTWSTSIDLNQSSLSSTWSANITQSGDVVTATPLSWNASVQPGQTISAWGYCASKTGSNWQPQVVSSSAQ